jgi:hypothetical protein
MNCATPIGAKRFMTASAAIALASALAEPLVTTHPAEKMTISNTTMPTAIPYANGFIYSFFILTPLNSIGLIM